MKCSQEPVNADNKKWQILRSIRKTRLRITIETGHFTESPSEGKPCRTFIDCAASAPISLRFMAREVLLCRLMGLTMAER